MSVIHCERVVTGENDNLTITIYGHNRGSILISIDAWVRGNAHQNSMTHLSVSAARALAIALIACTDALEPVAEIAP